MVLATPKSDSIQERLAFDDAKSPSDLRNQTREKQILFVRNEIVKLECKQLAESIVTIKQKPLARKTLSSSKKSGAHVYPSDSSPSDFEYELGFDETINVFPMWLDYDNVKLLARCREDILVTSLYDATIASAMQYTTAGGGEKRESGSKSHKASSEDDILKAAKPIKQIGNLFDAEIMGREVDFELYGLCHHCKQIKPRIELVRCCHKSTRPEEQFGKTVASSGTYKGT
jgi:hypothetical protein